jgi:hypothetical protein
MAPRDWLSRLEGDRTLRRVAWFWGIFWGIGYITQAVAHIVWDDTSIGQALLFQAIVLALAVGAVLVSVVVTFWAMSASRSRASSNEDLR